jgi:glycosyltransferase involved in cell wall biosynthesis
MRDHRTIARKFARLAPTVPAPAIIVAALPTIELSLEAVRYGRQRDVPVVLDMRDMWPDIFAESVPFPLRPLARLALSPLFTQARAACAGATAITGITDAFVDWGVERGGRKRTDRDRAFPMGYCTNRSSAESLQAASAFWDSAGVAESTAEFRVCFVGTLERQFDMHAVIEAARLCCEPAAPVKFIICGTGSRLEELRSATTGLDNILFPGWVDAAQIHSLMRRCSVGLDPLPDRYDFLATINNKAIEYLSAGLPVVSCPDRGVLAQLLVEQDCGASYRTGDADGLARTLIKLAASPARVRELSANARKAFDRFFTAEMVYGEMAAYLGDIVDAHAAHRRESVRGTQ